MKKCERRICLETEPVHRSLKQDFLTFGESLSSLQSGYSVLRIERLLDFVRITHTEIVILTKINKRVSVIQRFIQDLTQRVELILIIILQYTMNITL